MGTGTVQDKGVLQSERDRIEKEGTSPSDGVAKLDGRPSASTASGTPDLQYETDGSEVEEGKGVLDSQPATLNNEVNLEEVAPEEQGILAKQRAAIGLQSSGKPKSKSSRKKKS